MNHDMIRVNSSTYCGKSPFISARVNIVLLRLRKCEKRTQMRYYITFTEIWNIWFKLTCPKKIANFDRETRLKPRMLLKGLDVPSV